MATPPIIRNLLSTSDDSLVKQPCTARRRTFNASTQQLTVTSGYATWFTAGGAIRIAHYDVIDDS